VQITSPYALIPAFWHGLKKILSPLLDIQQEILLVVHVTYKHRLKMDNPCQIGTVDATDRMVYRSVQLVILVYASAALFDHSLRKLKMFCKS
jgi:hypothetical protein